MSLIVWYPLNGDLKNQGLEDCSIVNNGATIFSNGKIGKCYQFATGNYLYDDNFNLLTNGIFSVSYWVNYISFPAHNQYVIGLNDTTSSDYQFLIGVCGNGTADAVGTLTLDTSKSAVDLQKNIWYNVIVTCDGSKKYLYLNGELIKTYTTAINKAAKHLTINGRYGSRGGGNFYLNDVRIYDHCLSPKEVKELSKGLLVHYPMNEIDGVIGGMNLCLGTSNEYKAISVGQYYATVKSLNMATLMSDYGLVNGDKVTYSITLKSSSARGVKIRWQKYNSGSDRTGGIGTTLIKDNEGRVSITFAIDSNYSELHLLIQNGDTTDATTVTEYYKDVKLEKGDKSTLWTPAPADSNICGQDNIIQDVSGFNYNGIITSSTIPDWSNDTVIGMGSYDFAGNKKIHTPALPTSGLANSYTIAYWANLPKHAMTWGFSDGNRLNGPYNGLYWNTSDGSSNPFQKPGTTTTIAAPSLNTWHHYVITGDGTSSKLYIDGIHYGTAKTYKSITGTTIYINGWDSGTSYCCNGLINDFRIYTTALLEEDIKELYQTRFSIANNGTIFCTEYVEPENVFGGRNLLLNSASRFNWTTTRFIEIRVNDILAPYLGEDITVSFDAKINDGGISRAITNYAYQGNGLSIDTPSPATFTPTTTYQRFSFTTTVKQLGTNANYTPGGIAFYDYTGNNNYTIKNVKIELGHKATPWIPAPEDCGIDLTQPNVSFFPSFKNTGIIEGGLVEMDEEKMSMSQYQLMPFQLIEI